MRPVLPQITGVRKPNLIGPEASVRVANQIGSHARYLNSNLDLSNVGMGRLRNLRIIGRISNFRSGYNEHDGNRGSSRG